ncbi:glycosyltransferase [Rufibacter latericius]|uniref:Glycosyltransferase n=2 Tax=Rufibacter latericius TaxID=2487040 RepID=A0A3M9MLF1_9BACT|nr:glycosyltransferase [Rufibacter latericius]
MDNPKHYFHDVTLLITHYNRSGSLERLLTSFKELSCGFEDIVVSDDGSKPEHLNALRKLQSRFHFQLITTPVNKGLGHNMNKGQNAVKTAYTFYVQEDFVPKPAFPKHFLDGLTILKKQQEIDLVRFYAYFRYPYLKPFEKGFSEMVFKGQPWFSNHLKFYQYSDHPHLRRSNFLDKFGKYVEGKKGDITEFKMCLSFIKNRGKGVYFENFSALFEQKNSPEEPSTMERVSWRQQRVPAILFLRWWYLKFRIIKNDVMLAFTQKWSQNKLD